MMNLIERAGVGCGSEHERCRCNYSQFMCIFCLNLADMKIHKEPIYLNRIQQLS